MLLVFNDTEYGKGGIDWRLGKISFVKGTHVSLTYFVRGSKVKVPPMHTVQRSARDIFILYTSGDLLVNTRERFSALRA